MGKIKNQKSKIKITIQKSKLFVYLILILFFVALLVLGSALLKRRQGRQLVLPVTFVQKEKSGFVTSEFKPESLTVERIFEGDHSWVGTVSAGRKPPSSLDKLGTTASRVRTLIVTGDVILGRMVNSRMVQKNDFTLPFQKTADFLRSGDLTFVNFESPLVEGCMPTGEGMIFCGDPRGVAGLVFAGVDVASLANNHMGDYEREGIEKTIGLLKDNGISFTGVKYFHLGGVMASSASGRGQPATPEVSLPLSASGEPPPKAGPLTGVSLPLSLEREEDLSNWINWSNLVVREVRGVKFGFLGYNTIGGETEGISWGEPEAVRRGVQEARRKVDVLVVMFHWGEEYTLKPTEKQRELAHMTIEAGADLVLGSHPHWVQGVEIYPSTRQLAGSGQFAQKKLIVYSHGNFVFDQAWSRETREGVVGKYTFYDKELIDVEFLPILIEDFNQPRLLYGEEARKILGRMKESSK